ncbi:uncharacterized protein PGTG_17371 [Puccinia graminis f. sp. tritici CRL 75-36-700-3]|uniref:Small-subunit processome Utp12 domain-containing protein n=1 Tax=Puccinia graminis f. sp. tritici (strain CRL 75-36-700-3 / race SCCL) TaxID=418459 RepID=E3L4E0_PUCGT|nr:uncharacterized protein PGTG_17371 [Puccinia graminis f. sp. tritici CRL 75-36-700-3]EFP91415.2 hypothetical protein PGTG_17371 [Puccinia graminis f. sp. tritici CRL 75-36-700-3]
MVKSYFLHGGTEVFGLIASNTSNALFDGKRAFVPALEDVYVWDVKRGELTGMWHATGHYHPVTSIARSPSDPDKFAVGYQDGSVRIWSSQSKTETSVFEGHRRAISCLEWDKDGARLASGAVDGEVIMWDVAGESGLFKLRGHNNRITGLVFVSGSTPVSDPSSSTALPPPSTHLLSTSQDTYLKLWDLQTQHTVESVVAHRTESWSVTVIPPSIRSDGQDPDDSEEDAMFLLITTGGDGEAKLWTLSSTILINGPQRASDGQGFRRAIVHVGNLALNTSGAHGKRVSGAIAHHYTLRGGISGIAIAFQVGDRSVEVWRIRSVEEVKKKQARRKKKEASKSRKSDEKKDVAEAEQSVTWLDRLCPWIMLRGSGKISSFAFPPTSNLALFASADRPTELQILLALSNNSVEIMSIPRPTTSAKWASLEAENLYKVAMPGHRTDVRTVSLSFDDQLLASGSNGSLKVWNLKTQKCIRTMECGYALCSTWLPGNKHVLVGTKGGQLMLYELSSCALLQTCDAHTGAIWSIDLRPDGKGFVTGGADKCVKFWNFATKKTLIDPTTSETDSFNQKTLSLSMSHSKTMKMSDDVLGVRYSPDFKFLAVSTLDATVKIFFQDSLKFFLSLYGHKLPVLDMDISFDSKLVVTCSADKNVKIWGLDFGDCHKSIFAHEESVMRVAFESGSHYFWTVGRDKLVKYWDGDKFENIQTLSGHHKEVSSLAVSHNAKFLVTGSFDKSIRVWEKTDEPLFLEEEREKELERLYNQEENEQADLMAMRQQKLKESGKEGEVEEAGAVLKQTAETQMSGEKIIEALNLAAEDLDAFANYQATIASMKDQAMAKKLAPPARSPIFAAFNNISAHAYVLKVVERVPRPALEDALLVLPFAQVTMLLTHIDNWIMKGWSIPLVCRILFFILRTHESQITATNSLKTSINSIQKKLSNRLTKQREMVGYNVEAIKFLNQTLEIEHQGKRFYDDTDLKPVDEIRGMIGNTQKRRKVVI